MSLKIKLGKAEHDALEESLKSLYVADGENFKLDADYEDVTGLKNKNTELLDEIKKFQKKFEGIEDPEAARKALKDLDDARRKNLTDEERHKEDLKRLQGDLGAKDARIQNLLDSEAERDLHLVLGRNKVRSDKIEDATIILKSKHLKSFEEDGKPVWKGLNGDAIDLDAYITGLRSTKGDWFEPTTQPGGGASGSSNAGNGSTITRAQYEANPTQYAEGLKSKTLTVVD